MNTFKKIFAALLIAALSASLAACGGKGTAGASATAGSTADGGWQYNQSDLSLDKNPDAQTAFEKAVEGLTGCSYEPIALIGSQVAAGTNYCILCRATPVTPEARSTYVLLYIHAGTDGAAEITGTKDFAGDSGSGEPVVGGLEINQGETSLEGNADAKAAFDKALDGLTGCDYEAVAYIGSQVVAGTNYSILCRTTPVYPDAESVFSMVTVYEDLDGNAELSEVTDLEI